VSGEDDGEEGVAAEPEAEPEAEPLAPPAPPGVVAPEDGDEDDGLLDEVPLFFEASSPQAARVNAAAAAISSALVIPNSFGDWGAAILCPRK
jgi:hypothetical protein